MATVKVKENPTKTQYFWGPISDISGKTLHLIERNEHGDCLAMVEGKGLVDIDAIDVDLVCAPKVPSLHDLLRNWT